MSFVVYLPLLTTPIYDAGVGGLAQASTRGPEGRLQCRGSVLLLTSILPTGPHLPLHLSYAGACTWSNGPVAYLRTHRSNPPRPGGSTVHHTTTYAMMGVEQRARGSQNSRHPPLVYVICRISHQPPRWSLETRMWCVRAL